MYLTSSNVIYSKLFAVFIMSATEAPCVLAADVLDALVEWLLKNVSTPASLRISFFQCDIVAAVTAECFLKS